MMGLTINGERQEAETIRYRGDDYRVQIEGPAADGAVPQVECLNCGAEFDTEEAHRDSDGEPICPDCASGELEIPEADPEDWCNSAALTVDAANDEVHASISIGDPRGAFTFTIRRLPDGSANPGALLMHLPYAGMSMAHAPLTPLHAGTLGIGYEWKQDREKRAREVRARLEAVRAVNRHAEKREHGEALDRLINDLRTEAMTLED